MDELRKVKKIKNKIKKNRKTGKTPPQINSSSFLLAA